MFQKVVPVYTLGQSIESLGIHPLASSVQWFSRVWLFVTPWTAARQASLSFTTSSSLLKLISIESVMPSNHLLLCLPLLFFMAEWYSLVYMDHIFIRSSVCGHLGCLCVLAIINSAAMNIGVHVSIWIIVLSGYMPRSGLAGSYGNSVFSFLFSTVAMPT